MKKTVFIFALCFSASLVGLSQNTFPASGNVGIGTSAPTERLQVFGNISVIGGDISLNRMWDYGSRNIKAYTEEDVLIINAHSTSANGPYMELYGRNHPFLERRGNIRFISHGSTGEGIGFFNYDPVLNTWRRTMTVTNDNRVYIGNYKPSGQFADYKLGVDGNIVCRRMVVQITDWADFVFNPDYQLMPLEELAYFIKENKHLPNIPSEKTVLENGMDVSEMNKLLLQKVEELTLYMIELKKENEIIKAKLEKL